MGDIKNIYLKEMNCQCVDWIQPVRYTIQWSALLNMAKDFDVQ
jgi:hypothetical protein